MADMSSLGPGLEGSGAGSSGTRTPSSLCPVCEQNTGSHRHYGGYSCLSCKAFFRRAVTSKEGGRQKSCRYRKVGSAEDTLCTVKKCASCRWVRCKQSGMNPDLVLSGKKEALKHVGRANRDTLDRLKRLAEGANAAEEEESKMDISEAFPEMDDVPVNTDIESIVPSIPANPHLDNLLQDHNNIFICGLGSKFKEASNSISIFSPVFKVDDLMAPKESYCPALTFTCIQDYVVQLILMFLKNNQNFVSHTWASQVKLLRKNLPDMTVIILSMFFDRTKQCVRWNLSKDDTKAIQKFTKKFNGSVEIKKADLESHLGPRATKYILEVVNKLAQLELPKSVLLLLVLVCVFTRDNLYMEKQERVDNERREYLKLMFNHLSSIGGVSEATKVTAKIHSIMIMLRQFSENIRECEVNSIVYD